MTEICRLWRGELALADAFWTWTVFGGLLVNLVSGALFLFLIMSGYPVPAFIAGYAVAVPYNVVATVGVWRSAGRYTGDRFWADLARAVSIVGLVLLSIA